MFCQLPRGRGRWLLLLREQDRRLLLLLGNRNRLLLLRWRAWGSLLDRRRRGWRRRRWMLRSVMVSLLGSSAN